MPPRFEDIDNEIAGFIGTAEQDAQVPCIFIHNSTRDVLLLAPQVMITSAVIAPGATTARQIAHGHRRFTIDAQAFDMARCERLVIFFLY